MKKIVLIFIILLTGCSKIETTKKSNLTIVGDSRMVGLCEYNFYKETNGTCIAKVGMGYNWLVNEAINMVNSVENDKKEYIAINLGVNDLYNVYNYINKYKELIENDWKNSKIILVTVNPTKDAYNHLNKEIDEFNLKLKSLSEYENVIYCDTASILKSDGFLSNDGLHYEKETSKTIFDKILKCME